MHGVQVMLAIDDITYFLSRLNEISGGYEYQSIILKVGLINITKFSHLDSL